ncbi:MAG TPA: helix-turn-helix transcriptional regulator [Rhodocyclaceae bacterium]|nr:helix-turn-helix transcriptional regulator [Rhodocyclaceae bacterium]
MANSTRSKAHSKKKEAIEEVVAAPPAKEAPVLIDKMRSMAGRMLDLGSAGVDAARTLKTAAVVANSLRSGQPIDAATEILKSVMPRSGDHDAWAKAGSSLRNLREAAGLTVAEVGAAIDLDDPAVIEALESGRIALPFELILRLAAVLGRNDPISFVMDFTRSSNPEMWNNLEAIGIGKLVIQSAREREFANIYRGNDEARALSDEEFAEILGFARVAFEMAMAFRGRCKTPDAHSGGKSAKETGAADTKA